MVIGLKHKTVLENGDVDPKQMFKIAYLPLPTADVTSATTNKSPSKIYNCL